VSAFFLGIQKFPQNDVRYEFTRVDIEFLNMMPWSVNVRLPDFAALRGRDRGKVWPG
jgi:hypothetical protein